VAHVQHVFITHSSFVLVDQTVLDNKKELDDLKAKLEAIIAIVNKYQQHNGLRALDHRIECFCQCVTS
jgi:ATP-dependent Lon protease